MAKNPATTSVPKVDPLGEDRWMSMHHRFVADANEKEPEVVFLGDSLFANLGTSEIWDKMFEPLHCLNFGIYGDETQHILWRVENGELDNMNPKTLVIQIGTNNCANAESPQTSEQVYEGICKVVTVCQAKLPSANIVVMTIPPRGQHHNALREKIGAINHLLATRLCADTPPSAGAEPCGQVQVLQLDPGLFLNPNDGTISHHDMFDYLHFTKVGYEKFSRPIQELLRQQDDAANAAEEGNQSLSVAGAAGQ